MHVGVDLGYHSTKAICGDRWACFPSYAVRPTESLFSLNGSQAIVVDADPHGPYLVGEHAVKKGRTGARKETAGWITSPEYLALFRGALSELTRATSVTVDLVTGLPIGDYQRDKSTLRARLQGGHVFTRQGRRSQRIHVASLRVVPQAWGAVLALLLDDNGRIVRPELVDEKVAVLDVGGHTVNFLSVNGLSDVPEESKGTERGAWNVMRGRPDEADDPSYVVVRGYTPAMLPATVDHQVKAIEPPVDRETKRLHEFIVRVWSTNKVTCRHGGSLGFSRQTWEKYVGGRRGRAGQESGRGLLDRAGVVAKGPNGWEIVASLEDALQITDKLAAYAAAKAQLVAGRDGLGPQKIKGDACRAGRSVTGGLCLCVVG